MSNYYFDATLQRYRNNKGQFVSNEAIAQLRQSHQQQLEQDLSTVAGLLKNGKIGLGAWEEATAEVLKRMHLQSYLLGRGGQSQISETDARILGDRLRNEYRYLRGFADELKSTGMSEAMFDSRLRMYLQAHRGSYELGRFQGHLRAGYRWERRYRTKTESCSECLVYAARGWQPIGTLPSPQTRCTCKSNCGCYKKYVKSIPLDRTSWGWLN